VRTKPAAEQAAPKPPPPPTYRCLDCAGKAVEGAGARRFAKGWRCAGCARTYNENCDREYKRAQAERRAREQAHEDHLAAEGLCRKCETAKATTKNKYLGGPCCAACLAAHRDEMRRMNAEAEKWIEEDRREEQARQRCKAGLNDFPIPPPIPRSTRRRRRGAV
jgi:hypothetical protein